MRDGRRSLHRLKPVRHPEPSHVKTLVIYCHPNPDSLSGALFTTAVDTLTARGHGQKLKTTWLQLHNMNNVGRAECDAFVSKVQTTLKAM